MDFQQLQYFKILAKVQNFTRAADELAITQSALSRSIARLEEEMGVQLFERKVRGVVLNRYGSAFLQHVNQVIREMNVAQQILNEMMDPLHVTISLGFVHSLRSSFVLNLIDSFLKKSPGIRFQLTQDSTTKIINQLESAEIDLAFCSPREQLDNISTVPICDEELFLIVPKRHKLAYRKQVYLNEVANEPFVHYKHDTGLRSVIDKLCEEAGFLPKVSFEGLDGMNIAGLVAANFGVALIPFLPGLDLTKISLLHVYEPQCRRIIQMAWRTNGYMSPAMTRFMTFVEENTSTVNIDSKNSLVL
jgi:DNA-binding transcriptional LysR family regulator